MAIGSPFEVAAQDHLGVAGRAEEVPFLLQRLAQLLEVVRLTGVHDDDRAVRRLRDHRLDTVDEVHNG
jgi:hypothetical protein